MGKTAKSSRTKATTTDKEGNLLEWWANFGKKLEADRGTVVAKRPRRSEAPKVEVETSVAQPTPIPPADVAASCDRARLFYALWPDAAVASDIANWQASRDWPPKAPRVPMANLHMTLAFLGDLPREAIEPLSNIELPAADLAIDLDQFEIWPGGIAVLTPSVVPQALRDLQHELVEKLRAAGAPFDRRAFRPHVTVARCVGEASFQRGPAPPITWRSRGSVLVESAKRRYAVIKGWA